MNKAIRELASQIKEAVSQMSKAKLCPSGNPLGEGSLAEPLRR